MLYFQVSICPCIHILLYLCLCILKCPSVRVHTIQLLLVQKCPSVRVHTTRKLPVLYRGMFRFSHALLGWRGRACLGPIGCEREIGSVSVSVCA